MLIQYKTSRALKAHGTNLVLTVTEVKTQDRVSIHFFCYN